MTHFDERIGVADGCPPAGDKRLVIVGAGEAEKVLLAAAFPQVFLFRPASAYPVEPRMEPNFSYRRLRAVYPAFRVLFPYQVKPDSSSQISASGACGQQRSANATKSARIFIWRWCGSWRVCVSVADRWACQH
jgi:hypothetical protein